MLILIVLALVASSVHGFTSFCVRTPNMSVEIDASTGHVTHMTSNAWHSTRNVAVGVSWNVSGFFSLGENSVTPTVLTTTVTPCLDGGACVVSVWTVRGQRSDASCCQNYNVSVHQTFFAQGASVGWNVTVTSAAVLP